MMQKRQPLLAALFILIGCISMMAQAVCNQTNSITVTAGNSTAIVTGIPGASTTVCGLVAVGSTTSTGIQVRTGSDATCGNDQVNKSGIMTVDANGVVSYGGSVGGLFTAPTGHTVCVSATTGTVTGMVTFRQ